MVEKLERWLFVCSGNICRSPFAEAAARSLNDAPARRFSSAGTIALDGNPATRTGTVAARDAGIDLADHRATHLTPEVLAAADRIFGMEHEHVAAVLDLDPGASVELLDPDGRPIPDPYGGDTTDYASSYAQILDALRVRLNETSGGGSTDFASL